MLKFSPSCWESWHNDALCRANSFYRVISFIDRALSAVGGLLQKPIFIFFIFG